MTGFDQPRGLKTGNSFSHHSPTDRHLRQDGGLGRQFITGAQPTFADHGAEVFDDFLHQAATPLSGRRLGDGGNQGVHFFLPFIDISTQSYIIASYQTTNNLGSRA
jgi:hypothetical protein